MVKSKRRQNLSRWIHAAWVRCWLVDQAQYLPRVRQCHCATGALTSGTCSYLQEIEASHQRQKRHQQRAAACKHSTSKAQGFRRG
jgi:hypothetical protein